MKILIYGFKPFRQYKENITEKILSQLNTIPNLKKTVFDVRFDQEMFRKEIESYKPDIIIGMGQYPRGKKIRIERTAHNLRAESGKEKTVKVSEDHPDKLYATLKIKPDKDSRVTYNAGTYVCNFSMFTCLSSTEKTPAKYAFLHIPKDIDINKTLIFLKKIINTFQ